MCQAYRGPPYPRSMLSTWPPNHCLSGPVEINLTDRVRHISCTVPRLHQKTVFFTTFPEPQETTNNVDGGKGVCTQAQPRLMVKKFQFLIVIRAYAHIGLVNKSSQFQQRTKCHAWQRCTGRSWSCRILKCFEAVIWLNAHDTLSFIQIRYYLIDRYHTQSVNRT